MHDHSSKSFIYSLTNKDLFKYNETTNKAVYRIKDQGPTFGNGYDIYIANKANSNLESVCNINKTYINTNYTEGDN